MQCGKKTSTPTLSNAVKDTATLLHNYYIMQTATAAVVVVVVVVIIITLQCYDAMRVVVDCCRML